MNTFTFSIVEVGAMVTVLSITVGAVIKWVSREISELRHRMNNERQRTDALEANRTKDVERIAKLEAFMETVKDALIEVKASQSAQSAKLDQVLAAINR